jgi:hypothetical protein
VVVVGMVLALSLSASGVLASIDSLTEDSSLLAGDAELKVSSSTSARSWLKAGILSVFHYGSSSDTIPSLLCG